MKPLTWTEIDFRLLESNLENISKQLGPKTEIALVIKSDAYGFGLKNIVKFLINHKTPFVCVGTPLEALELRKYGYRQKIIILYEHFPSQYPNAV